MTFDSSLSNFVPSSRYTIDVCALHNVTVYKKKMMIQLWFNVWTVSSIFVYWARIFFDFSLLLSFYFAFFLSISYSSSSSFLIVYIINLLEMTVIYTVQLFCCFDSIWILWCWYMLLFRFQFAQVMWAIIKWLKHINIQQIKVTSLHRFSRKYSKMHVSHKAEMHCLKVNYVGIQNQRFRGLEEVIHSFHTYTRLSLFMWCDDKCKIKHKNLLLLAIVNSAHKWNLTNERNFVNANQTNRRRLSLFLLRICM